MVPIYHAKDYFPLLWLITYLKKRRVELFSYYGTCNYTYLNKNKDNFSNNYSGDLIILQLFPQRAHHRGISPEGSVS